MPTENKQKLFIQSLLQQKGCQLPSPAFSQRLEVGGGVRKLYTAKKGRLRSVLAIGCWHERARGGLTRSWVSCVVG